MKIVRSISLLIIFLVIGTAAVAQQQCALKLTDASPGGPYTAKIYVFYDGTLESSGSFVSITLNATTNIPFTINNDTDENLYRIVVEIKDNTVTVGYFPSLLFSTNYWTYNNINVSVDL